MKILEIPLLIDSLLQERSPVVSMCDLVEL